MTVSNSTARTSAVGTATAGQAVPFSFPIGASSELVVKSRVTTTGVEATLTETTDYTVAITGDTGGTVTMVAAWATTYEIWVLRNTTKTQSLDLIHGGTFSAENIEDALDKNCKLNVNQADELDRTLRAPDTDPTTLDMELPNSVDRASNYLAFDSDGEPTMVAGVAPTTATISAWAETLLDDSSSSEALSTLGFSAFGKTIIDDADAIALKDTTNLDHVFDVRDYGALINGTTDDTAAIKAAIDAAEAAGGGTVFLPKGTYLISPGTTTYWTLTENIQFIGEPGTIMDLEDILVFQANDADATLVLQTDISRGDTTLTVDNGSSVSAGDVLHITTTTNIGPGNKEETHIVRSVSGNTITLADSLLMSYATDVDGGSLDAGLAINAYNERKLLVRNIQFNVTTSTAIDFFGLAELIIERSAVDSDIATGTACLIDKCCNVHLTDWSSSDAHYGIETASVNGFYADRVFAHRNAQHPIAPGYGSNNIYINNIVGRGCGATVDSHFAFNVHYNNVDAQDTGKFSLRGLGNCSLRNAKIHTSTADTGVVWYEGNSATLTADTAIYDTTNFTFENIEILAPNITPETVAERMDFYYGENLVLKNFTFPGHVLLSSVSNNGFETINISNSKIFKLQCQGGSRISIDGTQFVSAVATDAEDVGLIVTSALSLVLSNCRFQDYDFIQAQYQAVRPTFWSNCTFEDCGDFAHDTKGAGTAAVHYFTNCDLDDVAAIAATEVLNNAHFTQSRNTGTTPALHTGSVTWDPASLNDGVGETSSGITVAGAALGDFVQVSAPYDLQDCVAHGYVQAANTIEIRLQNESGGVKNFASGTWRVRVTKL